MCCGLGRQRLQHDDRAAGSARRAACGSSGDFFNTLGVTPLLGRTLTPPDDDRRGCAAPPAVLGYGFWQREFGGNPSAIGRTLAAGTAHLSNRRRHAAAVFRCRGRPLVRRRAAAVLRAAHARRTSGLDKPDVWFLGVFGRLKHGWTREAQARSWRRFRRQPVPTTLPPKYRPEDAKNYLDFKLLALPAGTGVSRCVAITRRRCGCCSRPPASSCDCLREPREPDARAGHGARARNRGSARDWRIALAESFANCWPKACCWRARRGMAASSSRVG